MMVVVFFFSYSQMVTYGYKYTIKPSEPAHLNFYSADDFYNSFVHIDINKIFCSIYNRIYNDENRIVETALRSFEYCV